MASALSSKKSLLKIYARLLSAYGPRHWWPADTPEEVIIGAILTQNTSWKNVKLAIDSLKQAGLLDFRAIRAMEEEDLRRWIKSSGFFNQKARALKTFADYFGKRYGFQMERMKKAGLGVLREELLGLYRIGPETADSILLYALGKPIFVIDAYTKRIFSRHGFLEMKDLYEAFQKFFMDNLEPDAALYNEFHALIVHTGHRFCKPEPRCPECPLVPLLPNNWQKRLRKV